MPRDGYDDQPGSGAMAHARKRRRAGWSGSARFEVKDANGWQPEPASFDVVWIMESSEHFPDKKHFFERCALALKPGGTLAVCAWLRRDGPMPPGEQKLVATIAEAMMSASLDSLSSYGDWMRDAGLTVTAAEDITRHVEPTWAHCARIGANPALRFLVRFTGGPTRRFVKAFPLMQEAYASGAMAFGLFVAKKAGSLLPPTTRIENESGTIGPRTAAVPAGAGGAGS